MKMTKISNKNRKDTINGFAYLEKITFLKIIYGI